MKHFDFSRRALPVLLGLVILAACQGGQLEPMPEKYELCRSDSGFTAPEVLTTHERACVSLGLRAVDIVLGQLPDVSSIGDADMVLRENGIVTSWDTTPEGIDDNWVIVGKDNATFYVPAKDMTDLVEWRRLRNSLSSTLSQQAKND